MIGGIQRFTAIARVNERDEGRKITTRKCAVYGSGLSRSASLVLARQHNEFNQIQRTTSFPEIVASCRRLLFSHFAQKEESDDGVAMPNIPRYNTQAYRLYKQECLTFLVSSQVVRICMAFDGQPNWCILSCPLRHRCIFVSYFYSFSC